MEKIARRKLIIFLTIIVSVMLCGVALGIFLLTRENEAEKYNVNYVVGDAVNKDEFCSKSYKEGDIFKEQKVFPMQANKFFEGWYVDSDYATRAEFPIRVDRDITLYAKYLAGNLPASNIAYDSEQDVYYITGKLQDTSISTLVIPDIYNDGVNGSKKLTYIHNVSDVESLLTNNTHVTALYIGNNIRTINEYFAYNSTSITTIVFGKNVYEIAGTAFRLCTTLNDAGFVSNGWYNVNVQDLVNCEVEWLKSAIKNITISYVTNFNGDTVPENSSDYASVTYEEVTSVVVAEPKTPVFHNSYLYGWYLGSSFDESTRVEFPYTATNEHTIFYAKFLTGNVGEPNTANNGSIWFYEDLTYDIGYETGTGAYVVTISQYESSDDEVTVVPDFCYTNSYGWAPVAEVAGCDFLTTSEIYLGNNVNNMFQNYVSIDKLKRVYFSKNLLTFYANPLTFYGDSSDVSNILEYVGMEGGIKFPDRLQCLDFDTWQLSSSKIKTAVIPASVEDIKYSCFMYETLEYIETIIIDDNNQYYSDCDSNCIVEKETNTLILGCPTTTIPNDVEKIGQYAFSGLNNLNEIDIPSSVTSIGICAFERSGLTSMSLGKRGYWKKSSDESFTTGVTVNIYFGDYTESELANLFANDSNFSNYYWQYTGETKTQITLYYDVSSFNGNTPENWSDYGSGFGVTYDSASVVLDSIPIPKFHNSYLEGWYTSNTFEVSTRIEFPYTINESKTIYANLLTGNVDSMIGYDSTFAWDIGYETGVGAYGLNSGSINSTVVIVPDFYYDSSVGFAPVAYIKGGVANNATTAYLGNCVNYTGTLVGGSNLERVYLSQNLLDLQTGYGNYSKLSYVNMENGIKVPDRVRTIGNGGLAYFSNYIYSVEIPASTTSIGLSVCYGLCELTSIIVDSDNPNYYSTAVSGTIIWECNAIIDGGTTGKYNGVDDIIIAGCKNTAINDQIGEIATWAFYGVQFDYNKINWEFATLNSAITKVDSLAFELSNIRKVTFGDDYGTWGTSLTIGNSAFAGCYELAEIILGANVTSIGDQAFDGCASLINISNWSGVKTIGDRAFADCKSLTGFIGPYALESIGEYAFYNCTSLAEISLFENLSFIGAYAFQGTNLINATSLDLSGANTHSWGQSATENGSYMGSFELTASKLVDFCYLYYKRKS